MIDVITNKEKKPNPKKLQPKKTISVLNNVMLSDRTYNIKAIIEDMGKIQDIDLKKVKIRGRNGKAGNSVRSSLAKS